MNNKFPVLADIYIYMYIYNIYIYIYIYIYAHTYTNLPVNAIVSRLPHPRSGDGQETFLAPSADKQTRNYDKECSNHHPSLSSLIYTYVYNIITKQVK